MSADEDRLRRARRRWVAGGTLVPALVLAVTGSAVVLGRELRSPAQLAADAEPPEQSLVTATVETRVVAEPVVLRGKVRAGSGVRLVPPAAALGPDSVVTRVHAEQGDRIREGRVLLERTGEPLFVLVLPFRLYRDLTPGLTGPDVREVQHALDRLGYDVKDTGTFDGRTQQAVAELYDDRGYAASAQAPEAKPAATTVPEEEPAVPAAEQEPAVSLPQAHVLALSRAGQRISAVRVRVGDVLTDPARAVFDLDRGKPSLVAVATPDHAELLAKGQQATARDDGAGAETRVRISGVGTQAVEADGRTGFEVRFAFTGKALTGTGQRSVRVDVDVAGGADPVLAVPVSAIFSRADGSTFVTVVEGGAPEDVTVKAGRMAGGWVEIAGDSAGGRVVEGTEVVVSEEAGVRR